MFSEVSLPEGCTGRLFLHSMPGRYENFDEFVLEAERLRIDRVIRLAPLEEVEQKSPEYAQAIKAGQPGWMDEPCEVPDYGVPEDLYVFLDKARSVADAIRSGARVLIHCGAGIGRTGMFAICVLMALGLEKNDAVERVRSAGSWPETPEQCQVVNWAASELEKGGWKL